MVLRSLAEYVVEAYSQIWLPAVSCCLREDDEKDNRLSEVSIQHGRDSFLVADLIPSPRLEPLEERRPGSLLSSLSMPHWVARSQIFPIPSTSSKTGSWSSVTAGNKRARSAASLLPTISGPSDFRRVDGFDQQQQQVQPQRRRPPSYRPLELSIYIPNNRLSPLPDFSSPVQFPYNDPDTPIITPPLPVFSRPESIMSSTPSEFTVRRKPVGSGSRRPSTASRTLSSSLDYEPMPPITAEDLKNRVLVQTQIVWYGTSRESMCMI